MRKLSNRSPSRSRRVIGRPCDSVPCCSHAAFGAFVATGAQVHIEHEDAFAFVKTLLDLIVHEGAAIAAAQPGEGLLRPAAAATAEIGAPSAGSPSRLSRASSRWPSAEQVAVRVPAGKALFEIVCRFLQSHLQVALRFVRHLSNVLGAKRRAARFRRASLPGHRRAPSPPCLNRRTPIRTWPSRIKYRSVTRSPCSKSVWPGRTRTKLRRVAEESTISRYSVRSISLKSSVFCSTRSSERVAILGFKALPLRRQTHQPIEHVAADFPDLRQPPARSRSPERGVPLRHAISPTMTSFGRESGSRIIGLPRPCAEELPERPSAAFSFGIDGHLELPAA